MARPGRALIAAALLSELAGLAVPATAHAHPMQFLVRNRRAAQRPSLLLSLPLTATGASECIGAVPAGVTYMRMSSATCVRSDGSVVTLSTSLPRITAAGLLMEPGATNLALRSEELSSAAWSKGGGGTTAPVVTADSADVTAPDGTTTADRIAFPAVTAAGAYSIVVQALASTAGQPYTFSLWLRTLSGTATLWLEFRDTANTGQQVTVTASWQRFAFRSRVAASTTLNIDLGINLNTPGTTAQASPQTVYAWGAQAEQGAIETSYVKTLASAASRVEDVAAFDPPSGLSTSTGCAHLCVQPLFTGAPPVNSHFLMDNAASARWLYAASSADTMLAHSANGAATASVAAGFVAGARKCYLTTWAPGALVVQNLASGASATSGAFTAFSAFSPPLLLGTWTSSGHARAWLSSLRLGAAPESCQ